MDLFSALSDDQLAILGCFAALAVCGLIAMISFHFGPQGKNPQTPESIRMPSRNAQQTSESAKDSRKAA